MGRIRALGHLFQYWMLSPILIGALALAWVVQRTPLDLGERADAPSWNSAFPFLLMLLLLD